MVDINITVNGEQGISGANGMSAYDIAVKHGFKGTEVEWLESLKPTSAGIIPVNMEIVIKPAEAGKHLVEHEISIPLNEEGIFISNTGEVQSIKNGEIKLYNGYNPGIEHIVTLQGVILKASAIPVTQFAYEPKPLPPLPELKINFDSVNVSDLFNHRDENLYLPDNAFYFEDKNAPAVNSANDYGFDSTLKMYYTDFQNQRVDDMGGATSGGMMIQTGNYRSITFYFEKDGEIFRSVTVENPTADAV